MPYQGNAPANPLLAIMGGIVDAHKKQQATNDMLQRSLLSGVVSERNTDSRLTSEEKRAAASNVAAGERNTANISGRSDIADQTDQRLRDAQKENLALRRNIADHQAHIANLYAMFGRQPDALNQQGRGQSLGMLQPSPDGAPIGSVDPALAQSIAGSDPASSFNPLTSPGAVAKAHVGAYGAAAEASHALTGQRRAQTTTINEMRPFLKERTQNQGDLAAARKQTVDATRQLQVDILGSRDELLNSQNDKVRRTTDKVIANLDSLVKSRDARTLYSAMNAEGGISRTIGSLENMARLAVRPQTWKDATGATFTKPLDPENVKRGQRLMDLADKLRGIATSGAAAEKTGLSGRGSSGGWMDAGSGNNGLSTLSGDGDGMDSENLDDAMLDSQDAMDQDGMDSEGPSDQSVDLGYPGVGPAQMAPPRQPLAPQGLPFGGQPGATPVAPFNPTSSAIGTVGRGGIQAGLPLRPGSAPPAIPHHSNFQKRKPTGEFKPGKPTGAKTGAGGAGKKVGFTFRPPMTKMV